MRFVIFMDLFATVVQPAGMVFEITKIIGLCRVFDLYDCNGS
jgi:hypothetical protein